MMALAIAPGRMRRWLERPAVYTVGAPLLTVMGAATTVLAPTLLEPAQFGRFVLLASVFQYVADFDLGLSRLTDRAIALPPQERPACDVSELLWTRLWIAALMWLAVVVVGRLLADGWGELTMATASGGLVFMLSNGPVAVYRASGRIREFTAAALTMQFGMGLPRLLGLLVAGVEGCFVALVGWYLLTTAIFAAVLTPRPAASPPVHRMLRLIGTGLPLFIFGTLWSLYLLANRWIASFLVTPVETGLFGFGVTLVAIGVGVIGTIAQVHYPKHLARIGATSLACEIGRVLAVSALAVVAGVWTCHTVAPLIFPRFVEAMPSAAALLVAGLPLALSSWLVPLAIATATKPWREAPLIFGACMIVLAVCMIFGATVHGITGLAWGCLPSSALLLGILGQRLVAAKLLNPAATRRLLLQTAAAVCAGGIEWVLLFC